LKTKNQDRIDNFKSLRRNVKKLIHKKYTDYLRNLADSVEKEPKKFWSFYSTKTKSRKLPLAIKRNKDDINPVTASKKKLISLMITSTQSTVTPVLNPHHQDPILLYLFTNFQVWLYLLLK